MHALRIAGAHGVETVVLRRYVVPEVVIDEPDIAEREARTLQLLERCEVTTPRVLALDATGLEAGAPALVMSRVAGRLEWSPVDLDGWLRKLALVLPAIHEAPISSRDGVQEFVPYPPVLLEPPSWMRDRRSWERALDVFHGPRLDPERVFVHRDYHPGNVLWRRGAVSDVVDRQAASIGPRTADVWHCRGNLMSRFGLEVADRFLQIWQTVTGSDYNPWAEAVMLVDAIGWRSEQTSPRYQVDLQALLARRLAELGA